MFFPCNEYIVQEEADLADITPAFGDKAYVISTGQHFMYGESTWHVYYAPTAYVAGGGAS